LQVLKNTPHRLSEIWKLDHETSTVVVLGPDGIVKLNQLGSAIWLRLDGEHTITSIIGELTIAYPSQEQVQIEKDVVEFINNLVVNNLVILRWNPLYKKVF